MLSIIIPSRQPQYLQKTIDDLLAKAEGEVEVIVILDGYWPDPMINDNPKVRIIHQGTVHDNKGMRAAINAGVAIARGDYLMKIDEHCMVSQGYDLVLAKDCPEDTLVVPRRKRLDPEKWELIEDGRPPIDYMIIDYPFARPYDDTCGLHGAEYRQAHYDNIDKPIDDLMTMQGSCYFLSRKLWDSVIVEMDDKNYGPFTMEAQELSNKVWLSGGRVIVNKNAWYAHYHKGNKGKGYGFSRQQYVTFMEAKEKGRQYAIDYWLVTKDFKHDFAWLVDKFSPLPGWPEDWKERITEDSLKDFRYSPDFGTWGKE